MELIVATTNPHKVRELSQILAPLGVRLRPLEDAADVPAPVEDGETFAANARKKAQSYAHALGLACLADDSGLEVDALGGAPGVRSARYAGEGGTRDERDRKNREKLIEDARRAGALESPARLVCVLCLAGADGSVLFEARGTMEGRIIEHPRGEHGFGYDAHLYLPDVDKTAAELPPEVLNRRSHRAQAALALAAWLARSGPVS